MKQHCDISIIGAGINGLAIASALGEQGFEVVLIDKGDVDPALRKVPDGRGIAISKRSKNILKKYGLWDSVSGSFGEIHKIIVKDSSFIEQLEFDNQLISGEPLGFIIESDLILKGLYDKIQGQKNIRIMRGIECSDIKYCGNASKILLNNGSELESKLVVVADGKNSRLRDILGMNYRSKDYKQYALVFSISHSNPHNNCAYEYFFNNGPFASLPLSDPGKSSIVWTEKGNGDFSLPNSELEFLLNEKCGDTHGVIKIISSISKFPLSMSYMNEYHIDRVVFIGDCLHSIHPLAGQGFNLSIRDIDKLVSLLEKYHALGLDIGSKTMLNDFQSSRKTDNLAMIAITDGINRLFSNDLDTLRFTRRVGISLVKNIPAVQKLFMNYAMGNYA